MRYLLSADILLIHSLLIEKTGGGRGVRDAHAILALETLPSQTSFGQELYPEITMKAAVYARNIIMSHPFVDGNKRTGMTCAIVFLEDNGFVFQAQEGDIETFAVSIVTEHLELEDISHWFALRTKRKSI